MYPCLASSSRKTGALLGVGWPRGAISDDEGILEASPGLPHEEASQKTAPLAVTPWLMGSVCRGSPTAFQPPVPSRPHISR